MSIPPLLFLLFTSIPEFFTTNFDYCRKDGNNEVRLCPSIFRFTELFYIVNRLSKRPEVNLIGLNKVTIPQKRKPMKKLDKNYLLITRKEKGGEKKKRCP